MKGRVVLPGPPGPAGKDADPVDVERLERLYHKLASRMGTLEKLVGMLVQHDYQSEARNLGQMRADISYLKTVTEYRNGRRLDYDAPAWLAQREQNSRDVQAAAEELRQAPSLAQSPEEPLSPPES